MPPTNNQIIQFISNTIASSQWNSGVYINLSPINVYERYSTIQSTLASFDFVFDNEYVGMSTGCYKLEELTTDMEFNLKLILDDKDFKMYKIASDLSQIHTLQNNHVRCNLKSIQYNIIIRERTIKFNHKECL